jgi:hypothetical protein
MTKLKFESITIEQAKKLNPNSIKKILHKTDGSFHSFKAGHLVSERGIIKDSNFPQIIKDLKDFPDCVGEIFYKSFEESRVFDVTTKTNQNLCKFMVIDILNNLPYEEKQKILKEKIKQANSNFIAEMREYSDLETAWNHILKTKSEGLILKTDFKDFKVKLLQEDKVEIVNHEAGSEKGTFLLKTGDRISGTSRAFVNKFYEIKAQGKIPIMEVEYQYLTKENKMYQSRCRKIYAKGEEND